MGWPSRSPGVPLRCLFTNAPAIEIFYINHSVRDIDAVPLEEPVVRHPDRILAEFMDQGNLEWRCLVHPDRAPFERE